MGQTLFIVAASLAVGGVIMSQRGKVTNEASVKAARAVNSEGVGRDKKRVEEPVYTQENGAFSVHLICCSKQAC